MYCQLSMLLCLTSVVLKHLLRLLIAMDRRSKLNCSASRHEVIWGDGVTTSHISSLMLVGGEWMVSFRNRSPFSSRKDPQLLTEDEALWAPELIWTFRRIKKSLFFSGNRNTIPRTSVPYGLTNSEQLQIPIKLECFGFHCDVDEYRCLCVTMRYRLVINHRRFGEPFNSIFKVV
jgi:hypothetical protein